jgi:hypothetical protein
MRHWKLGLALGVLPIAGCGADNQMSDVEETREALSGGAQALCQDCSPFAAVMKLTSTTPNAHRCSGAKIGIRRILTSARCLDDMKLGQTVSTTNRVMIDETGTPKTVLQTFIHPSFSGFPLGAGFDAAVLELTSDIVGYNGTAMDPLPIDDEVFGDGWQFPDIAYGQCSQGFDGRKQVGDILSIQQSTYPNYIRTDGPAELCTGDFGGVLIHGFNAIAGINSFTFGPSYITRTQPIRSWIQIPTRIVSPFGYKAIISKLTGRCLQNSGGTITEQWCSGQPSQQWTFPIAQSGQGNAILNRSTGLCLGWNGTAQPAQVSCSGTQAYWQISPGIGAAQAEMTNYAAVKTLVTVDTRTVQFGVNTDSRRWWFFN